MGRTLFNPKCRNALSWPSHFYVRTWGYWTDCLAKTSLVPYSRICCGIQWRRSYGRTRLTVNARFI